jgi:hypothetical protein
MILLTGKEKVAHDQAVRDAASARAQFEAQARELARLEQRIEDLRREWQYERERADRAADALLASKGLPTIMPESPRAPDMMDDPYATEDPKEVEKMLKAMGLERKHAEA